MYVSINTQRCETVCRGNSGIEKALFHYYYASMKERGGSNFMGNNKRESMS